MIGGPLSRYTVGTGKHTYVEVPRACIDFLVEWIKARHAEKYGKPPLPKSEQIQPYDRLVHVGGLRPTETCPNCGVSLEDRGCKLRCPNQQCGYFVSCSEF